MVVARDVVAEKFRVPDVTKSYSRIPDVLSLPDMITIQTDSYKVFKGESLQELFDEISPIADFTGNRLEMRFAADTKVFLSIHKEEDLLGRVPTQDVKVKTKVLAPAGVPLTREKIDELRAGGVDMIDVTGYYFGEPKYNQEECRERDATFAAPLKVNVAAARSRRPPRSRSRRSSWEISRS